VHCSREISTRSEAAKPNTVFIPLSAPGARRIADSTNSDSELVEISSPVSLPINNSNRVVRVLLLSAWLIFRHRLLVAMAKSKTVAPEDELDNLFEGLGDDVASKTAPSRLISKQSVKKSDTTAPVTSQSEKDLLAELENLGSQTASQRPHTPRVASNTLASQSSPGNRVSLDAGSSSPALPPIKDEKAPVRKSEDSTLSNQDLTPSATSSEQQDVERRVNVKSRAAAGAGWWGGLLATANAAVKTAEAAVKEIQQNEEAKRWAEQVKGNVGALRGLGGFDSGILIAFSDFH
jgi:hypothetical protein